jgi:hypothetical protein
MAYGGAGRKPDASVSTRNRLSLEVDGVALWLAHLIQGLRSQREQAYHEQVAIHGLLGLDEV